MLHHLDSFEEEKKAIFNDLFNFIIWEKEHLSKRAKLQRNLTKINWQKRFGIGFVSLFSLATVLLSGSSKITLNHDVNMIKKLA